MVDRLPAHVGCLGRIVRCTEDLHARYGVDETTRIDFSNSSKYTGYCFLYIFSGMLDAVWQNLPTGSSAHAPTICPSWVTLLASTSRSSRRVPRALSPMDNDKHPFMTNLSPSPGVSASPVCSLCFGDCAACQGTRPICRRVTVPGRAEEIAKVDNVRLLLDCHREAR